MRVSKHNKATEHTAKLTCRTGRMRYETYLEESSSWALRPSTLRITSALLAYIQLPRLVTTATPTMKMLRLATIPEDDSVGFPCFFAQAPRCTRLSTPLTIGFAQHTSQSTTAGQPLATVTSFLEPIYHFANVFSIFQTPLTLLAMGLFALSH